MRIVIKGLLFLFTSCSLVTKSQTINHQFIDLVKSDADSPVIEAPQFCYETDYSSVWLYRDSILRYGFIGDSYQRIDLVILSSIQSKENEKEYLIKGKSRVKNNVCSFKGVMTIQKIYVLKNMHFGVDSMYRDSRIKLQGITVGVYKFLEDSTNSHQGIFEGAFASKWYIDKNEKLKYDNIQSISDGYWNNCFVGTWKSFMKGNKVTCNWGDWRIMFCGDLDIGAGEFSPNEKYAQYGWQNYIDAYFQQNKAAMEEEKKRWW